MSSTQEVVDASPRHSVPYWTWQTTAGTALSHDRHSGTAYMYCCVVDLAKICQEGRTMAGVWGRWGGDIYSASDCGANGLGLVLVSVNPLQHESPLIWIAPRKYHVQYNTIHNLQYNRNICIVHSGGLLIQIWGGGSRWPGRCGSLER